MGDGCRKSNMIEIYAGPSFELSMQDIQRITDIQEAVKSNAPFWLGGNTGKSLYIGWSVKGAAYADYNKSWWLPSNYQGYVITSNIKEPRIYSPEFDSMEEAQAWVIENMQNA